MTVDVAAFWSYAHADDDADCGRIRGLSATLRSEYRIQTGEDINVFIDNESLEWGAEWKQRIDDALSGTTFFIPIITPGYFKSQACRRELLKFAREARRFNVTQLLMPVYWVTVQELDKHGMQSNDEAIALIARHQWQDLRIARLEDETSSLFRKAIFRLASELVNRVADVSSIPAESASVLHPVEVSLSVIDEDEEPPGDLELAAIAEEAFPKLSEILEEQTVHSREVAQAFSDAVAETNALPVQTARARLRITDALARRLASPAHEIERLGHEYAEVLSQLDPAVHSALDQVEANAFTSADDAIARKSFLTTMQRMAAVADEALGKAKTLADSLAKTSTFARSLRQPVKEIRAGLQGMIDGRALIDEWSRRAREIERRNDNGRADEV